MVGRMSRDLSDIKDWYQKLLKGSHDFTKKGSSKPQEKNHQHIGHTTREPNGSTANHDSETNATVKAQNSHAKSNTEILTVQLEEKNAPKKHSIASTAAKNNHNSAECAFQVEKPKSKILQWHKRLHDF